MTDIDPILPKITRFLKKTGMAPTMFGLNAVKDANLVRDLNEGRELRRKMRQRIDEYMASYKAN